MKSKRYMLACALLAVVLLFENAAWAEEVTFDLLEQYTKVTVGGSSLNLNHGQGIVLKAGKNITLSTASSSNEVTIDGFSFIAATKYDGNGYAAKAREKDYDGGGGATAVGYNSEATEAYATAVGWKAKASGESATAVGHDNVASKNYATALGYDNLASAEDSTAIGFANTASSNGASAVGKGNTVGADSSSAFGYENAIESGSTCSLFGARNQIAGSYSTVVGSSSSVTGDYSLALGSMAVVGGSDAVALGRDAQTSASGAMSMGVGARATGANAVVLGSFSTSSKLDYAVDYCKKIMSDEITDADSNLTLYLKSLVSTYSNYASMTTGEFITMFDENMSSLIGSFEVDAIRLISGNVDGSMAGSTASGENAIAIGVSTKPQGNMASQKNSIAIGTDAQAKAENAVALGYNSVASEADTISVGSSDLQRRIVNVADGTADTDAATVGQLKAKSDYYVKSGNVRVDTGNNKTYLDLDIYNNASGTSVKTISVDLSSVGGSTVSGDKILTAGTNIGFTEYVDADGTTKYAVGLTDNISDLRSVKVGTTTKNIYLDDDGVSVTGPGSITDSHLAAVMTADSFYLGEGQLNASTGAYDGEIYSSLSKDELRINKKTYINANGIDANNQKIVNVANGTVDTDVATYGQVKNAFISASLNGNILTLSPVAGNATNIDLSSLVGSGGSGAQSDADVLVHKDASDTTAIVGGTDSEAKGTNALAIGNTSKANGQESVAIGYNNNVTGTQSTVVGNNNRVTGNRSGAFGDPSYIDADNSYGIGNSNTIQSGATGSFAVGNNNNISGQNTFVLGSGVTASSNNSVVLGNGSADGGDNTVSVGSDTLKRKIVNVAPGENPTDAVNLSQVNALLGTTGTGEAFYALQDEVAGMQNRIDRMGTRINKVGAGAAALAAMHPVYDEDCRLTFSAGLGAYRNEKAAAVGAFYRFNERMMMNCGAAVGNDNNIYNLGLNIALDKIEGPKLPSKAEMAKQLFVLRNVLYKQTKENNVMKVELQKQNAKIAKLMEMVEKLGQQDKQEEQKNIEENEQQE